jgi:hypothetical protein
MTETGHRKEGIMAISFPAPEVAAQQQLGSATASHTDGSSLLARAGRLLERGYGRVCSAIFDPDGDCMRL